MEPNSAMPEEQNSVAGKGSHPAAPTFNDAQMEIVMGRLLRTGVLLAATVVLAGGSMYVSQHAGLRPNYRVFVAQPLRLRHPAFLVRGIGKGDAAAIIEFGILLLVATPICRVIFAVIAFAIERDRLYVAISLAVLGVLLFGMLRGG
jgi:uncharacterized membrane protein